MPAADFPPDEPVRLAALREYEVLDTECEGSFQDLAKVAALVTGCPIAAVSLVDAERLWSKAAVGPAQREMPRSQAFCAHAILRPREMLEVPDASADPRFADNPQVTGEAHLRYYCGAPLVTPDGQALGTLCVLDRVPRRLGPPQREALAALAHAVATTLELRRLSRRMHALALTDTLTGLSNRAGLQDALAQVIRGRRAQDLPFALLYLDLDGFKAVNDRAGHAAGDALLIAIAQALRESVRSHEVAARLGGDEFAVLLPGCAATDAAAVAERVRRAVAAAGVRQGAAVTASVGLACFQAAPESVDAAIRAADHAMYAAKQAGGDRVEGAGLRALAA